MHKIYLLFLALSLCSIVYGQDDDLSLEIPTFHTDIHHENYCRESSSGNTRAVATLSIWPNTYSIVLVDMPPIFHEDHPLKTSYPMEAGTSFEINDDPHLSTPSCSNE
ncbi:hypothetical protein [Candidatus Finniella inopinata]|uniref:Uncharacterized protein n=1 Tax=Candidatus Finniella inopinata TaxID=1696036 RepID=A0A4Q7DJ87_9PROT|nr:hypothetical protein [Candidatus Finniella inopinata]RZI46094.1 hypothetical protein EQU50_03950 [Candidatus Finniella inopinata]